MRGMLLGLTRNRPGGVFSLHHANKSPRGMPRHFDIPRKCLRYEANAFGRLLLNVFTIALSGAFAQVFMIFRSFSYRQEVNPQAPATATTVFSDGKYVLVCGYSRAVLHLLKT